MSNAPLIAAGSIAGIGLATAIAALGVSIDAENRASDAQTKIQAMTLKNVGLISLVSDPVELKILGLSPGAGISIERLLDNVVITCTTTGQQGASGADGKQGDTGPDGKVGASGEQGASGSSGQSGQQGESGSSGSSGQQGSSGSSGQNGQQGVSGESGEQGVSGSSGSSGQQGASGSSGQQGASGSSGSQGSSGASGSTQGAAYSSFRNSTISMYTLTADTPVIYAPDGTNEGSENLIIGSLASFQTTGLTTRPYKVEYNISFLSDNVADNGMVLTFYLSKNGSTSISTSQTQARITVTTSMFNTYVNVNFSDNTVLASGDYVQMALQSSISMTGILNMNYVSGNISSIS